jgi:hypothetical protein
VIGQPLTAINLPGIRPWHDLRSRHRPKQPKRPQRGTLNPPATKRRLGRPERQITKVSLIEGREFNLAGLGRALGIAAVSSCGTGVPLLEHLF